MNQANSTNPAHINKVFLAFDYGRRRTGVAVGQSVTGTASPLLTLEHPDNRPDWTKIDELMTSWRPYALIVGEPATNSTTTTENSLALLIDGFCLQLITRYALPVHRVDESFTSVSAHSELRDSRRQGRRKRISKLEIDALAAAMMLESWMSTSLHKLHGQNQ